MIPELETAKRIAREHCAAWTSRRPDDAAVRYSSVTSFSMNGGEPMTARSEIAEMAAGFMSDFPDLILTCDTVLAADHHMTYAWTFEGRHKSTGNLVKFSGWEEWDLDSDLKVSKSLGWYDVADYERQVAG
jgi:nuclear transport factor 2 (NTF2) superfamily protein